MPRIIEPETKFKMRINDLELIGEKYADGWEFKVTPDAELVELAKTHHLCADATPLIEAFARLALSR